MTEGLDSKSWGLIVMSIVAALSAFQVYSLTKQLEKQNQKIIELA
jgi:hypothetical protein